MASIILAGVGAAIGSSTTTAITGVVAGKLAGSLIGGVIDQGLFGNTSEHNSYDRRLDGIAVQSSNYGRNIATVYGIAKLSGNIIWSSNLTEHSNTTTNTHGSKWHKVKYSHTEYSYTLSLAIAICAGPITSVEKIWANDILLDKDHSSIRIYLGGEEQMPDPLIESIEGIENTPAYRGLAYVVFENLNITDFGNRLPHFTFEIRNALLNENSVENTISAVNVIPGSGEFVYDTEVQYMGSGDYIRLPGGAQNNNSTYFAQRGHRFSLNCHSGEKKANSIMSLDQLKVTLPKVRWVAPVVAWFANSLNAANCKIMPGVEYENNMEVMHIPWKVRHYDRVDAHKITKKDNKPIYGGTTADTAIIKYLQELRKRGYKVMFYPMLFVDTTGKPWRGRITCKAQEVKSFFRNKGGYNAFILHYARLTKNLVDAFIIGSELRGLTTIHDEKFNFPAVQELVELAKEVRTIMGSDVKISYAADWSEYHHTSGGWYNMDELWGCHDIDFIGIDAYFPLTDWKNTNYDINDAIAAWDSGEGFDFFYTDTERTIRKKLDIAYAWKNITWWWSNTHINPDSKKTSWVPRSKKIWFTEYGFPSVDLATNQPNVFFDPESSESGLPYHSSGSVDLMAQRIGIEATERRWQQSDLVENKFLWTWDARPYPVWPDRSDLWNDSKCWYKGHWVQGKLGMVTLAALLTELAYRVGLTEEMIDVSDMYEVVEGFIISGPTRIHDIIEKLRNLYLFDVVEKNYKLHFISRRSRKIALPIHRDALIPITAHNTTFYKHSDNCALLQIKNLDEMMLPKKVSINFINRLENYSIGNQCATRDEVCSNLSIALNVPIVMDNVRAHKIAHSVLYNIWNQRQQYNFVVPITYTYLVVGDIVTIENNDITHRIRITGVELKENYTLQIYGVADNITVNYTQHDISEYQLTSPSAIKMTDSGIDIASNAVVEILDIPMLPDEVMRYNITTRNDVVYEHAITDMTARILIATCGTSNKWPGCDFTINTSDAKSRDIVFGALTNKKSAIIGRIVSALAPSTCHYIADPSASVLVNLIHGKLESITRDDLLAGKNIMLIGDEIIQFQYAELVDSFKYRLKGIERGLFGTEAHSKNEHKVGERAVFFDQNLQFLEIPHIYCMHDLILHTYDNTCDNESETYDHMNHTVPFHLTGHSLLPLSPTHLRIQDIYNDTIQSEKKIMLSWYARSFTANQHTDVPHSVIQFKIRLLSGKAVKSTIYTAKHYHIFTCEEMIGVDKITVNAYSEIMGDGNSTQIKYTSQTV